MTMTTAVLTNPNYISNEKINENEKVINISEKILIEKNQKFNKEFEKIQERINNVKLFNSLSDNYSKQKAEIENGYHGPRNYFGLESIIEFCNDSLASITKLDKLYLDKLYLYIEYASSNKILGIKNERNPIYSEATNKRIADEKERFKTIKKENKFKIKLINEQLNKMINMISIEEIIDTDNEIYYFSKKQMSKSFKMLISEIVELIENSKLDKLILEDNQGKHYLVIDDNYEEAFFCLKKITYIMQKAIEHDQTESVNEKQKRLLFQGKKSSKK